jgi:hypothetical protein
MGNLTIGRRRFLQSLGIGAATVPFVVGLDSLYVHAQVPVVPKKRFLFMYSPNGMLYYNWRLRLHAQQTDISDGAALASKNLILNPLQPNASKLLVLDRLSFIGARGEYHDAKVSPDGLNHPGGHQRGIASMLTGSLLRGGDQDVGNPGLADGISLDQVLATRLFKDNVKFPSIEVGVQVDENLNDRYVDKRVSYNKSVDPRTPNNDPFDLFQKLFGNGGGGTDQEKAKRQFLDKSVLDAAVKDFERLQPKLSSSDRLLLQQHADAIRAMEKRLGQVIDCGAVQPPTAPAGVNVADRKATHDWAMKSDNFVTVGDMQMEIVAQAMSCGLTNICTFMWSHSETNLIYKWLPIDYSIEQNKGGHHAMSHARAADLALVDQWYAKQFNTFIDKFSGIKESEGNGTLLDNSLLMWTSCLSDGAAHESRNTPIVLAGSNGGYFKQGLNIQFNDVYTPDQWDAEPLSPSMGNDVLKPIIDKVSSGDQKKIGSPDLSNQDLCVNILNSFGLEDTTFGDPRFCKGALPLIKA